MATLHCIKGGRRVTTREMLDKMASQNYQMATENTQLKQEVTSLRDALLDCHQNLTSQTRKILQPRTREIIEKIASQEAPLQAKAAAQS